MCKERLLSSRDSTAAAGLLQPRDLYSVQGAPAEQYECVVYPLMAGKSLYGDAFDEPGEPEVIVVVASPRPRELLAALRYSPILVPVKSRLKRFRRVSKRRHNGRVRKRHA